MKFFKIGFSYFAMVYNNSVNKKYIVFMPDCCQFKFE